MTITESGTKTGEQTNQLKQNPETDPHMYVHLLVYKDDLAEQ